MFRQEDEEGEEEEEGGRRPGEKHSAAAKRAAFALAASVGSFSDPPSAQGLAHFLEHMARRRGGAGRRGRSRHTH